MTNKYQSESKADLHRPASENMPGAQGEVILPESHSQDADRKRKAPHPKSDK